MTGSHRAYAICEARAPICPKCSKPMHGVRVRSGTTLVTCSNGGKRSKDRCAANAFLVAGAEGSCIVVLISRSEREELLEDDRQASEILAELGVLTQSRTFRRGA